MQENERVSGLRESNGKVIATIMNPNGGWRNETLTMQDLTVQQINNVMENPF